jgi:VanZ family protein
VLKTHSWFLLACAYTFFVFAISLIKINPSIDVDISNFDKLVHAGIYFIFTIVWFVFFVKKDHKHVFYAALLKASALALVVGIVIEYLQYLNPNARSGDVKDVIANAAGIVIAMLCIVQIKKYRALNSTK